MRPLSFASAYVNTPLLPKAKLWTCDAPFNPRLVPYLSRHVVLSCDHVAWARGRGWDWDGISLVENCDFETFLDIARAWKKDTGKEIHCACNSMQAYIFVSGNEENERFRFINANMFEDAKAYMKTKRDVPIFYNGSNGEQNKWWEEAGISWRYF